MVAIDSNRGMTAVDLFCGVGGLSLGFEGAGFDLLAAIDSDPIHLDLHRTNFPHCENICCDIAELRGSDLQHVPGIEHIDVLIGGPPCQGFSTAGRRDIDDPRNKLIFEFARLVGELQPRYFVMENVHGLMMGQMREELDRFVEQIAALGYAVVSPIKVLNTADYGVPQNRKRVIVLGYQIGLRPPSYPTPRSPTPTVKDALRDLAGVSCPDRCRGTRRSVRPRSRYVSRLNEVFSRNPAPSRPSGCTVTKHTAATVERFKQTPPGMVEPISRFFRLSYGGQARAIRAGTGPDHGSHTAPRPIHPENPRCITVREAARLHSFPDWFEFHPTIWHGFREVGNSVPPLFAHAVAEEIRKVIREGSGDENGGCQHSIELNSGNDRSLERVK